MMRKTGSSEGLGRRAFLVRGVAAAGGGLVLGGCKAGPRYPTEQPYAYAGNAQPSAENEPPVTATEDLMREHGVLRRALLVYGELIRRVDTGAEFPPQVPGETAILIREFVEQYHERMEEDYVFPRFLARGQMVDLVNTLQVQHDAGRRVTTRILSLAQPGPRTDAADRRRLAEAMRAYIRMYEPHGAREDTVLFPALRKLVTPSEFDALGEQFEKIEHTQFGADGFERYVDRVASLEKRLGIEDLSQFTPREAPPGLGGG